jgi:hypothetical protein
MGIAYFQTHLNLKLCEIFRTWEVRSFEDRHFVCSTSGWSEDASWFLQIIHIICHSFGTNFWDMAWVNMIIIYSLRVGMTSLLLVHLTFQKKHRGVNTLVLDRPSKPEAGCLTTANVESNGGHWSVMDLACGSKQRNQWAQRSFRWVWSLCLGC